VGSDFALGEFTKGFSELQLLVSKLEIQTASSSIPLGTVGAQRIGKTDDYIAPVRPIARICA
jgi:hypothetical protein